MGSEAEQPMSLELGVDPAILRHAHKIENPPSFEQLCYYIGEFADQFRLPAPVTPSSQYIFVTQISAPLFSKLEQDPDLIRGVRATILHTKNQVLYKVMVSLQHNTSLGTFTCWIGMATMDMRLSLFDGDYWVQGAARMRGRIASKEPDFSFVPGNLSTEGGTGVRPSLIMEIGFAESMPQLRTNAQWWYSNSNGQTGLIILIQTYSDNKTDSWFSDIEIWTEVDNKQPTYTRGQPNKILKRTQHTHLENGIVEGAPLKLDFEALMRRPPQNEHEKDLELTVDHIYTLCGKLGGGRPVYCPSGKDKSWIVLQGST